MNRCHTCCVFGHRSVTESPQLYKTLYNTIEKMIVNDHVDTFLFGSKSRFNDLCHDVVTQIKEKHPHIRRIYVRAEYPHISEQYKNYLLEQYEDTYYPERILGSNRSVYIERNREMINNSRFCIVYYDKQQAPTNRKSGTRIALDYAVKSGNRIIQFPLL